MGIGEIKGEELKEEGGHDWIFVKIVLPHKHIRVKSNEIHWMLWPLWGEKCK